jgi:hypothetical protein
MPWHIGRTSKCPPSEPFGVIKDADGSVAGCHATRKEARKQMAALYANEPMMKAEWDTAYINDLPDSAFACIDGGGHKDAEGKTTPRSLRHYPHHTASGAVDRAHLANARARVEQAGTTSCGYSHLFNEHSLPSDASKTMKAEQIGSAKWRVLAIPFGGPFKDGKDFDGEWFDHDTDIKARWFKERPVLFHHGQDEIMGDDDLGVEDDLTEAKDGWWGTLWLDRSHRYWAEVDKLIRAGKMYGSSGAVSHLVRKSRSGHIDVWPHAEQTLTPTPANPYARITAAKAIAGFDQAGIAIDDPFKAVLADLDRLADDLHPDLPDPGDASADLGKSGDDAAMKRLASGLDELEAILSALRSRSNR